MQSTTESITTLLRDILDGHENHESFAKAIDQLQLSFKEYFDPSTGKPAGPFFTPYEQAFRQKFEKSLVDSLNISRDSLRNCIESAISLSLWSFYQGFVKIPLIPTVMEDTFNMLTISQCEDVFDLFEKKSEDIRKCLTSVAAKNRFLKPNNTMLLRLSRSINVSFKGRVLLFVALILPVGDRSGLNQKGDCNVNNVIEFEDELPDDMDVSDTNKNDAPIDYTFYRTFWGLQNYFRQPDALLSSSDTFSNFIRTATTVINAFSTSPVHYPENKVPMVPQTEMEENSVFDSVSPYFKYLTSTRLFQIQLGDVRFQRHVLVQFCILFHHITSLKEKKCSADEEEQLQALRDKVNEALKEPVHGSEFASMLENALSCEAHWIKWKNDGCKGFDDKLPVGDDKIPAGKAPSFFLPNSLPVRSGLNLGSPQLTEIWNFSETNYDCLEKEDLFPSVKSFTLDPLKDEPEDEDEDLKLKNDIAFGWKSVRLIARQEISLFSNMNYEFSKLASLKPKTEIKEEKMEESN